jgi:lactoylglutathione lyase
MRIEHVAIWTKDLEVMKSFYQQYFKGVAGEKYVNSSKKFTSYFLTFEEGARLELMHKPEIAQLPGDSFTEFMGFTHLAVSVGSKRKVNELTEQLRHDGFQVLDGPRITGDGYYESVVLDPESNRLEITV